MDYQDCAKFVSFEGRVRIMTAVREAREEHHLQSDEKEFEIFQSEIKTM